MCYFITIAVPKNKAENFEKTVPRGLHIGATSNRTLKNHLPDDVSLYLVMSGGCSCDLFSENSKGIRNDDLEEHVAKLRRKYQKKGWSEAKTERAIAQAMKGATSSAGKEKSGLRFDVREFLAGLLNDMKEIGVFVQWYGGNVESEDVIVKQGPKISGYQLRVDNPVKETGKIYTVTE